MKTLVLGATKGGVGKTTLAAHLAVAASGSRFGPVAVVDLDKQASLTDWRFQRQAEQPVLVEVDGGLRRTLDRLQAAGAGLVVIDCPPGHPATIAAAVALADLLIIPTQSSPTDLRAIGPTVDIAEQSGTPFAFVLNRAIARTKLVEQAAEALKRHGPLAAILHQRVDFPAAMTDGRTAGELRRTGKAAAEIAGLWRVIEAHLRESGDTRDGAGDSILEALS